MRSRYDRLEIPLEEKRTGSECPIGIKTIVRPIIYSASCTLQRFVSKATIGTGYVYYRATPRRGREETKI